MTERSGVDMVVLAGDVLGDGELEGLLEGVIFGGGKRREKNKKRDGEKVLGTGVDSVDEALGGGVVGGRVVGVNYEQGSGGSEFCRTLLVNSLLEDQDSTAAVVDATGNFDVARLYTLILYRLQHDQTLISHLYTDTGTAGDTLGVEDVAARVLDRVKIMRVFDFVGVMEAVSEVREELEGTLSREKVVEKKKEETENVEPSKGQKRTMVPDSEDEEDDDEMLFDLTTPVTSTLESDSNPTASKTTSSTQTNTRPKTKLILIDNLPHVLSPLLKQNPIEANALAHPFLYALTHLTKTHALYTLILLPTTLPHVPLSIRRHQEQHPQQQQQQQQPPPASIFSSSNAVLALGNVVGRYVDLEVLVTRVPRRKADAGMFYSGGAGRRGRREGVGVVEVVGERWEGRVGAWGTFCEGEGGIREVV